MNLLSAAAFHDFVAHAPLQAWCGAFLFGAVVLATVVCLTVGLYVEMRGPRPSMARMLRQRRKARRSLSFTRR